MIVISHPTGNQNVRQALAALRDAQLLEHFHTTVYWDSRWLINSLLPAALRSELNRRTYPQVSPERVSSGPLREAGRLLSVKFGLNLIPRGLSTKIVSEKLDTNTARYVDRYKPAAVYAYDGAALETFQAARRQGTVCVYELPRGYWRYDKKLLEEEALLRPDYAATIESFADARHYENKDRELSLADHIIVPSGHVSRTLRDLPSCTTSQYTVPYGTNELDSPMRVPRSAGLKLRVLFVGQLTQRKGIAYLFDAVKMMKGSVDLTVIGRKGGPSSAVDRVLAGHRWIPSLPHEQILNEMAQHDVLVLPALTEAFGLVIAEALSRGVPVITTTSTGGPELIRDGQDGFFVPMRSAEAIAEKLELLHRDHELLEGMSESARRRAREFTWERYRKLLIRTLLQIQDR